MVQLYPFFNSSFSSIGVGQKVLLGISVTCDEWIQTSFLANPTELQSLAGCVVSQPESKYFCHIPLQDVAMQ